MHSGDAYTNEKTPSLISAATFAYSAIDFKDSFEYRHVQEIPISFNWLHWSSIKDCKGEITINVENPILCSLTMS